MCVLSKIKSGFKLNGGNYGLSHGGFQASESLHCSEELNLAGKPRCLNVAHVRAPRHSIVDINEKKDITLTR